jgi:hypothetical protein
MPDAPAPSIPDLDTGGDEDQITSSDYKPDATVIAQVPDELLKLSGSNAEPAAGGVSQPSSKFEGAPSPPVPERKPRRISKAVYLVLALMLAAAFVLGLVFSDWGREEAPEQPHVPVVLQPLVEKPALPTKPTPSEARPRVKKVKSPKRVAKRKKPVVRVPGGTGYLNVNAPAGSKVYIRGRFAGNAPLKRVKLPAGKHKVVVVREETGSKYKRTVPIRSGHEMTLTVDFY